MCSYKIDKRQQQSRENLERCYKVVQQSSRSGISAIDVAKKLGIHRVTAHSYLTTLELMERVYSQHGLWFARKPAAERPSTEQLFLKHIFQQTDEIKEILFGASRLAASEAFSRTRFLIAQLPPALKDKMKVEEEHAVAALNNIPVKDFERYQNACYTLTRELLDKLYTSLYQEE